MRLTGTFTAPDGTDIWYGVDGTRGPTVVLCDGIGCDGYIWPYMMDHFDGRCTFVRWHYRGHGNSGEPDDPARLSIEHLVDDLRGILDHLETTEGLARPALLIGHSMGCQVTLEYTCQHPDDVSGMVLLCGCPGRPLDTFRGTDAFKNFLDPLIQAVDRAPSVAQSLIRAIVPSRLGWTLSRAEINTKLVRRQDFMPYLKHIGQIRPETFLRMLRFAAEHDTSERLPNLQHPALVVAGALDSFTPLHLSERMAELIPNAELVVFPEGSHSAPLELHGPLNGHLDRFFKERSLL